MARVVHPLDTVSATLTPLGKHFISVEGDSVLFVSGGPTTYSDMVQLLRAFSEVREKHHQLFVLYDSRKSTGMDPAARKLAMSAESAKVRADVQVSFGAPFAMRVMMNMFNRAWQLLGRDEPLLHAFDTEAEARAFFNAERARLRAALASSHAAAM